MVVGRIRLHNKTLEPACFEATPLSIPSLPALARRGSALNRRTQRAYGVVVVE